MDKPVCGEIALKQFEKYVGSDREKIKIYAAGFVAGQCEKVYLGACSAAMFRPSADWASGLMELVKPIAADYGLIVAECNYKIRQLGSGAIQPIQEVWVLRDGITESIFREMIVRQMDGLHLMADYLDTWHRVRGILCGIPSKEIDTEYHKRSGYAMMANP